MSADDLELEARLREQADSLSGQHWRSQAYEALEAGISAFLQGDSGPLERVLDETEDAIDLLWEVYCKTSVVEAEVTAETVVGHRLLQDGMQGWLDATSLADAALEGGVDWDEVLALAEQANRLLMTLQYFCGGLRSDP